MQYGFPGFLFPTARSSVHSLPLLDRLGDLLKVPGTELDHAVIQSLEVSADKSGITQTLTTREVMP